MKVKVKLPTEIEVTMIRVVLNIRNDDEDIPFDFPLRRGDAWDAMIDIETGQIRGWPAGEARKMAMKVCDEGSYYLIGPISNQVAAIENDYVPHGVIPGSYGDYVKLEINESGVITNWPRNPDVSRFFPQDED